MTEIENLKAEVARVKAWEETKQRYELVEPGRGVFVWTLKKGVQPPEPPHWICAKCYEDGKRSIVQMKSDVSMQTYYTCFECKSDFHIKKPGGCNPSVVRRPGGPNSWMAS